MRLFIEQTEILEDDRGKKKVGLDSFYQQRLLLFSIADIGIECTACALCLARRGDSEVVFFVLFLFLFLFFFFFFFWGGGGMGAKKL